MSISMLTDEPTTKDEPKQQTNCHNCKQFQIDVAKSLELMAQRMDQMQHQLDDIRKEKRSSPATSSAVSSGKASPSPLCVSPKQTQLEQPTEQKPIIQDKNHQSLNGTLPNGGMPNGSAVVSSGARKRKPKERTPPTAASPLPDFSNFVNGFMFDPITMAANPNGMIQLLSLVQQQTQGGSEQQQEQSNQTSQQTPRSMTPPETKQIKMESTENASETADDARVENEESSDMMSSHTQHLLDALTAQFTTGNGSAAVMNHRVKSESPNAMSSSSSTGSSAVQQVIEAVATPSRSQDSSMMEESIGSSDPNTARCSNCRTDKTTAWRRDSEGKLVCNPCGLYYRLHKVRRPIEMRKNHIQQRYRRKNKEKDVAASLSDSTLFNQLLNQMPTMATGGGANSGGATSTLSFLEQITQFTQAHELMNSSAAGF